jgi:hypothetical protein
MSWRTSVARTVATPIHHAIEGYEFFPIASGAAKRE